MRDLVLLLLTLAGVTFGAARVSARRLARDEEMWRNVVAGRGRVWRTPSGLDMALRVNRALVTGSGNEHAGTTVQAAWVMGAGPDFRVTSTHAFSPLSRVLGEQDIRLDDEEFDTRFVVQGTSPDAVVAAWSRRARDLRKRLGAVDVVSDGLTVRCVLPTATIGLHELDAAVELVAELAQGGCAALAALETLPGAVPEPTPSLDDPSPPRVALPQLGVTVGPAEHNRRVVTVVRAALPRAAPPFQLMIDAGGALDGPAPPLFGPAAAAHLPLVGPATLIGREGQLTLRLDCFTVDEPRLLAAARLCHTLATQPTTYR
jgi:hypothetical protein